MVFLIGIFFIYILFLIFFFDENLFYLFLFSVILLPDFMKSKNVSYIQIILDFVLFLKVNLKWVFYAFDKNIEKVKLIIFDLHIFLEKFKFYKILYTLYSKMFSFEKNNYVLKTSIKFFIDYLPLIALLKKLQLFYLVNFLFFKKNKKPNKILSIKTILN